MRLQDIPIRRKLMLIILLTTMAALLLMRSVFFTYEFLTFRQATLRHLSTVGEVIAANSTAALAFDNQDDAKEILTALKAEQHVTAAALYDKTGKLFAKYPAELPSTAFPNAPGKAGYHFQHLSLVGFQPVVQRDRHLGTLYLKLDTGAIMHRWFWNSIGIASVVIAIALLVAYLISKALQKQISQPILSLAETAKAVSSRRDYSVRATKVGEDEVGLLMDAFNQMLTQIQEQTQALSESEARARAVLNSAISAVVVIDAAGNITDWNARAEQMFGWTHRESLGQELAKTIIPPQYREAHRRGMAHFLATGEGPALNRVIELSALRRDGSEFPVELTISPLKSGGVMTFCGFITDITERKRTEETDRRFREVQEQNRLVVEANRMKSEFLANMSHELRTPLNGIIGFSEFLVDEKPGKLNEKQREYLNDILNSGRHLLQLINDVLDLSKVEAGKMELFPESFSLPKSVEEVCAIISPLATKKNVAIQKDISRAVENVTLDQQKFKQVLFNLLSNAVKFTDDGGRVEIVAAPCDPDRLLLQVRDTGIGIKPEDFDKLFIEFQQLDSGTDRHYEGTGLGLALTKKIVEFQKGSISVESVPGKGSVFTVVLPLAHCAVHESPTTVVGTHP